MKCSLEEVFKFLQTLIIEPLFFLAWFSFSVRSVTFSDMLLSKACYMVLQGKNESENCTESDYASEAESIAALYQVGNTVIGSVPAIIISILLAPWSDRYGRRLPLIFSLTGLTLQSLADMVISADDSIHIAFTFLSSFLSAIGGNIIVILMCCYSYISDMNQTKEGKTVRYALIEFALFLGMLGTYVGGQIRKYEGFVSVFGIAALGNILGIVWTIFVFRESRKIDRSVAWGTKIRDLFSFRNFQTNFKICLKKREGNIRFQTWFIIMGMTANLLNSMGTSSIGFLFAHEVYNWDNPKYSNVQTFFLVITALMTMTIIPLFVKVFHVSDVVLGLIGTSSAAICGIIKAFAYHTWLYYLGSFIGTMTIFTSVASRSRLSKLIPKEDIGNVFSIMSVFEAISPSVGTALLGSIFSKTIKTFPGLAFLVSATFLIVPGSAFVWMWKWGTEPSSQTEQEIIPAVIEETTTRDKVGLINAVVFGETRPT